MKNLYIPKGKTLHYETLYCQNIVNDGTLIVDGTLHARSISGKGILKAGTVSVRHVAEMDIECATMNGETMAAERVLRRGAPGDLTYRRPSAQGLL